MFTKLALAVVLATTALACTTTVTGDGAGGQTGSGASSGTGGATLGDAGSGDPCTHDSDCAEGVCAFRYDESCNSITCSLPYTACPTTGWCVMAVLLPCLAITTITGCACDDTDVTWTTGCSGLPHGYSPVPISALGPCGQ